MKTIEFGKKRLVRFRHFKTKQLEERLVLDEVARVTNGYGPEGRKLVVTLKAVDVIEVREVGSPKRRCITVNDLWWHLLRVEANLRNLERAREIKEKKERRKAEKKLDRDYARLRNRKVVQ